MQRTFRHRDKLVPTKAAALAAGVSEATIRKWASRGKLTRYGSPGRAHYDVEELLRIVTETPYATGVSRSSCGEAEDGGWSGGQPDLP